MSVILVAIYNSILTVRLFNSDNYTGGLARELSWMYGELAGSVVCASASSLRPFFVRYIPSLISSHFLSDRNSGDPSNRLSRVGEVDREHRGAYELDSMDGVSVGKKHQRDDDETQLWRGSVNAASVSADGAASGHDSGNLGYGNFKIHSKPVVPSQRASGISVVSPTSVAYM